MHPENLLDNLQDVEIHNEKGEGNEHDKNVDSQDHLVKNENNDDNLQNLEKQRALLTPKEKKDESYINYTVCPLYSKTMNVPDAELYQMLKVYAPSIGSRTENLDLMCFPVLFPMGRYGQYQDRSIRLRESDFIKNRLISKHSRFRLDTQYIFFCLYNQNCRQINAGIYHLLNIVNPHYKWTAADLLQKLKENNFDSNVNTVFSRIRGTQAYWVQPRNQLNTMMREYGPATFFITLSPGEWMWSELGEYIRKVNGWINDSRSISELITTDSVSASRFIHNRFGAMLAYILSSANPIGKVEHYYYVCEYQGRGLPHFHCIFWIKNAPIYGKSSNEDVKNFILQHITCRIPDKRVSPELHRRVQSYQQHKDNNYCLRKKPTKSGCVSVCRFGFPRPVTKDLILRNIDVAIANKHKLKNNSRFYNVPRDPNETYINDYMPVLLAVWEGNMDAQYIGESSYLLTRYVSSYGTKGEKSTIDCDFSEMKNNKSLCSRLWSFALRSLNHRECGAIEAADTLLGHPLHATDSDTVFRWLNVNMIRSRRIKRFDEIKNLPPESSNIFYDNFIDTHYPNRHKKLENLCLYDFARWFDIWHTEPKNKCEYYEMGEGKYCRKRSKPYLITHYNFNPLTNPEAYYYALLLLFLPWRDLDELKRSQDTYVLAFMKEKETLSEAMKHHEKCETIREAINHMTELIEKQKLENTEKEENSVHDDLPDGCVPIETENAMKDFEDAADKVKVSIETLEKNIVLLNTDQMRIFMKAKNGLLDDTKPLRLAIFGSGGTGKSHVIESIVAWNRLHREKKTLILAPTGIAAFNINGLTIHKALQIPVEQDGTAKYKGLSAAALKRIRQSMKDADLIIIDEISMVSDVLFMYIHLRLTEIFTTSEEDDGWFGKKNVILFGDLLQLPPVDEDFVFVEMTKVKISKYIGAMTSYPLWSLFDYDELTINMRQKNDKIYSEILGGIRLGILIDSDIEALQKRKLDLPSTNYLDMLDSLCERLDSLPTDTVCLLPTKIMCKMLNDAMLSRLQSDEIVLVANDCFLKCAKNLRKKVSNLLDKDDGNACGIERVITIKIGCKIMIRRNIDVSIGLVNGTIGTVVSVSRDDKNYVTNISIQLKNGQVHSITRLQYQFVIMQHVYITREQFPICCSFGITIHKSQGLSLQTAVVEAGNRIFSAGQTYVALSRVTNLEGLFLINFDPSSIFAHEAAILEYNRIRKVSNSHLEFLPIPNRKEYEKFKVLDNAWCPSKGVLLAQSNDPVVGKSSENYWNNFCGLPNENYISSYANVCVQSLLHCDEIRSVLQNYKGTDIIKSIFNQYMAKTSVDVITLRRFVHEEYSLPMVHDAAVFLQDLCGKFEIFQTILSHQLQTIEKCFACNDRSESTFECNFVFKLHLPDLPKTYTLQDIIDYNLGDWFQSEEFCHKGCKTKLHRRVHVTGMKTLLIIKFLIFPTVDGEVLDIDLRLKEVPKSKVCISCRYYKVINGIFHSGTGLQQGDYFNILKQDNKWVRVHDSQIETKQWPKCAKNAYILFLREIPKSKFMN